MPIYEAHGRYLRFMLEGVFHEYTVTLRSMVGPQGLTMVLRTIVTWLRLRGVHIHTFLDILLLVGCSVEEVLRALALTSRPQ